MFKRPSVSGDRKAANLCKLEHGHFFCSSMWQKEERRDGEIERSGNLIWTIYHANILAIWKNVCNQIQQVLVRNMYILKPNMKVINLD
jgi:hypothetical protein